MTTAGRDDTPLTSGDAEWAREVERHRLVADEAERLRADLRRVERLLERERLEHDRTRASLADLERGLAAERADHAATRLRLDDVLGSTSWRIAWVVGAPLRWLRAWRR